MKYWWSLKVITINKITTQIINIFLILLLCILSGCAGNEGESKFDYNNVKMTEVSSSLIHSIGYDEGNLVTKFKSNGSIYVYYKVPAEVYDEFLNAESKGTFFNNNIKDVYQYECVEGSSYVEPDFTESTLQDATFVVNTNTRKFHKLDCRYAKEMTSNMHYASDDKDFLISHDYSPCKVCNP